MSWFKAKIVARFSEPSTYAGLAAVVAGVGQMFQVYEAAPVAEAINQVAAQPTWQSALLAGFGLLAVLKSEKGAAK